MDPKARRLSTLAAQIVQPDLVQQADDEAVEVSAVPDLEDVPDLASCAACPAHNDGHDGAVRAAAVGKCPSHHDGGDDECAVHAARRSRRAPPVFSSTAARERASAVAAAMAAGRPPPPRGLERKLANYGDAGFSVFLRKAFIKAMGYTDDALTRPIVGITNTYSGYNACHRTVPDLIDAIKRGVTAAGGLPIEFPIVSIHEAFTSPTSMFLRNLMAMDCEELVRAQPMDAVVLIGGCDKTVPALLMGAASANVPAVMTVTGPMLTGNWNGEELGACTDCRRLWGLHRGDELTLEEVEEAGNFLMPSAGTCQVMGTASTMALMAEAIGMMLPGGASIPAVHADRLRHAELSGARAVELARLATQDAGDTRATSSGADAQKEGVGAAGPIAPTEIMTQKSMENALRILLAVGGSTNGLVHIAAIAGRLGLRVDLEKFDRMGRETPVLVDLKPTGVGYMEDFHKAGGIAPVLRGLRELNLLHLDCVTVSGMTLGEQIDSMPPPFPQKIIRPISDPVFEGGSIAVLRGNLCDSAIVKQSASTIKSLLQHKGRAVVFEGLADMAERLDSEDLDVTPDDVLVLKGAGPVGAPGMPEAGYIPIPKKLARAGVKDMVRMSDCRMSGTAFGTIILHCCPESAVGGNLGLVENGDEIELDTAGRRLHLHVADEVLAQRRAKWAPPPKPDGADRGYYKLYFEHVLQAEEGCDFDFMLPAPMQDAAAAKSFLPGALARAT